jgi:hypothetical protein
VWQNRIAGDGLGQLLLWLGEARQNDRYPKTAFWTVG